MTFSRMIVATAITLGAAFAVTTAAIKCDEKAQKASSKKASCCSMTKATKVSATTDADHCSTKAVKTADAKECSAEATSCSTTKMAAKKVKAEGSCCSTKGKAVKVTEVTPAETPETASNEK